METTINTIEGSFVVPADKQAALLYWLQANAIKVGGTRPVYEQSGDSTNPNVRQLINESNVGR